MITTKIDQASVNLPELDAIPVAKTRDALERALKIVETRKRAYRERDAALDAVRDAGNDDRRRLGERYFSDPEAFDANPSEAVEAAEKVAKDAQSRLDGLADAERRALVAIREAINADAASWAKTAAGTATKALTKLTTATRMAEAARIELLGSVGVLGLLRARELATAGGGEGPLVVMPRANGYTFDLDPAVAGLRAAIAGATSELRDLT